MNWYLVIGVIWLLGGLACIGLDQAGFFFRCLRGDSDYGDVGWEWIPPRTTCDWGEGPQRDPGSWFWTLLYSLAVIPPLGLLLKAWLRLRR